VRDGVRNLTVAAFRDRKLSRGDMPKLVHEVLEGAVESIDWSIPASSRNILREVFEGLREGVHSIASAGSATMSEVCEIGQEIRGKNLPGATRRVRAANDEFLRAVKNFAGKTSKQVRKELDVLVARAERTAPKVANSARSAARAVDGHLLELTDEAARAGVRVVRHLAGFLAMGAGGVLEGIAEAITPATRPITAKKRKLGSVQTARKKTKKKAAKKKSPTKDRQH
jgi:hypothetical protein